MNLPEGKVIFSYLKVTAKNLLRDEQRRQSRIILSLENILESEHPIGDEVDFPGLSDSRISDLLKSTRGPDKKILILKAIGYTNKEIANEANISQANVAIRLHRIKNKLRKCN